MYEKLLEVQKKVGAVTKDKQNPFFKSNYADINNYIDVLKPILNEVGLVVLQPLSSIDGKPAIRTIVMDDKDKLEFDTPIIENPDPQKQGAVITYFRRYALQSLFFLQAEDDDANIASLPQNDTGSTFTSNQGNNASEYKDCPNKATCGGRIKGNFDLCYNCNQAKKNASNVEQDINPADLPF